jgi:hypothetical protein
MQFYDYADLKPGSLHRIAALTQQILADAGVSAGVKLCRGNLAVSCEGDSGGGKHLVIRLVAGRAKTIDNVHRPILGLAFAGAEGGTLTSVFLERVQESAAAAKVPWEIVAAEVAAHEAGHLLLGPGAHTTRGLMKAKWDQMDYQTIYAHRFRFSDEQAHQLTARHGGLASSGPAVKIESCR